MNKKDIKRIAKSLKVLAIEIGFNGFANFSQRQYSEELIKLRNEVLELK